MSAFRQRFTVLSVSIAACALFTLLFLRLGHVQVIDGATYYEQAEDNRFFEHVLLAPRGIIMDRYGEPLVWNTSQYAQIADPDALFSASQPISRQDALQHIASSGAEAVTAKLQRMYRYPKSLAHVVGYVGEVTAEELQQHSELRPGMVVGKAGLEVLYEKQLRGRPGSATYEINALGRKQRQVDVKEPVSGEDLKTSIDPYLSEIAGRKLGDVLGTVIITDAETGKVIALTSQPGFDPNTLSQNETEEAKELERRDRVQQLFTDPRKLFFNRAISGAYPPGSVFKLMTALVGLEQNKVDSSTEVIDEGVLKVGEYQFGNWYFRQYGRVEGAIGLQRAISRSNDIFFYKVAEWVGPTALAEFARTFGFGSKTNIELPAEARGLVPDPLWKETHRGEQWFLGNTYHFGIGQGDLLTSPIQIAQMTQAIAHNGQLCPVSLLLSKPSECKQLTVTQDHLNTVLAGMIDACSAGGTAFPFFPYNTERLQAGASAAENFERGAVACKTGTAEFGGADEQGHRRTHAWFTSFLTIPDAISLPSDTGASPIVANTSPDFGQIISVSDEQLYRLWTSRVKKAGFPKHITITVMIESDDAIPFREGSRDAAPVAKQIVDWMTTPK
jgi:penicillin-binding protein 2